MNVHIALNTQWRKPGERYKVTITAQEDGKVLARFFTSDSVLFMDDKEIIAKAGLT